MPRRTKFAQDSERLEVLDVHASYLEHVIGANLDTLSFRFTAPVVDHRSGRHVVTSLHNLVAGSLSAASANAPPTS
jgi:hypothetical protein